MHQVLLADAHNVVNRAFVIVRSLSPVRIVG